MSEPAQRGGGPLPRVFLAVLGYAALVLGVALVRGRELSVHEAVQPETSRAMFADHDWLVPKRGDLPWLENPPLPQWVTVALATPFGRCDELWIVRLPSVLAGLGVALLVAWLGARLFGRTTGLLAGLVTVSTYELARYSWLAEDEILLTLLVTAALVLFARAELVAPPRAAARRGPAGVLLGRRPPGVAAFFVVLGLTGLVKGPGFGAALVLAPVAGFLLVARDRERLSRWAWAWGWLLALVLVAAWPALVVRRHPDVLELWSLLFGGRVTGERLGEPFWYYAVALLWTLLPWTPFAAVGLVRTWREARAPGALAQRFVLAWALLVPLLLSLPDGKHHHYLLHALPAWALLAARGLGPVHARALRLAPRLRTLPAGALLLGLPFAVGAALLARQAEEVPLLPWLVAPAFLVAGAATWRTATSPDPRRAAGATFAFVGAALVLAHAAPPGTHHEDARFLRRVAASEHEAPLALDMSMGTLRGFHCLFYLHGDALSLHNLSFLRSDRLAAPVALVLTRGGGRAELERYGEVEVVDRSARSGRSTDEESLLTLFRLRFAPDLERVPVDGVHVSPLQAMYIEEGPFLEPPRAHEAGGS